MSMNTQAVAVVNEAFARRNLGGASPIGEQNKGIHGHRENGKFVDDCVPGARIRRGCVSFTGLLLVKGTAEGTRPR
jgi:hypothetical protein